MAAALSTVGAALTAQPFNGTDSGDALGSAPASNDEVDPAAPEAEAQVPVRPGLLSEQAVSDTADEPVPQLVRIRNINLEAPILSVGVDEDYRFDVPEADLVGWYKYSSRPGTDGSAVLAAHVDYGGRAGAFYNLRELKVGDRLEVVMSDGSVLAYSVTDNTLYDKTQLPAEQLFRKDGAPVLQLITCGGTFDPQKRSYVGNLVVSATPETT